MKKDDETPMNALVQAAPDLLTTSSIPTEDARIRRARSTMRDEVGANLLMLDQLAETVGSAEEDVRIALADLARAVEKRNEASSAYNAGARGLNRMLSQVAEVRLHMGDDDNVDPLDFAVPELDEWDTVEWPEEQWPDSELVDLTAFDMDQIVGGE